jgi:hypothetical protein
LLVCVCRAQVTTATTYGNVTGPSGDASPALTSRLSALAGYRTSDSTPMPARVAGWHRRCPISCIPSRKLRTPQRSSCTVNASFRVSDTQLRNACTRSALPPGYGTISHDQKPRLSWPARCLTLIEFRPRAGPTFRGLGDCPDVQAQTRTEAGTPDREHRTRRSASICLISA